MAKFRATLGDCPSLAQPSMKHPSEMHSSVNSFISASQLLKRDDSNVSDTNAGYIIHQNTNTLPSMKHNPSEESISLYQVPNRSIFPRDSPNLKTTTLRPSTDPIIQKVPAACFTEDELIAKRMKKLTMFDETGREWVFHRMN